MAHPSVMMRRDVVEAVGGYRPAYVRAEDYDLWCRVAEVSRLANLAQPLLKYRVVAGFRPKLFSCQVKSEIAVRAAAALRRAGQCDPTGEWREMDSAGLALLGIDNDSVSREIARRSLQMARELLKLGDRDGAHAALHLADEQPCHSLAEAVAYRIRRTRVFL